MYSDLLRALRVLRGDIIGAIRVGLGDTTPKEKHGGQTDHVRFEATVTGRYHVTESMVCVPFGSSVFLNFWPAKVKKLA